MDRQAFKDVTFTNSVVRYHGGAVSLSNVTFVNCRFVLDLFSAPASQPQQLLLLALLESPDLRTVNRFNGLLEHRRSSLAIPPNLRHNKSLFGPRRTLPEQGYTSVLMIRLSRMGARKQPHYRIVVIEKARARNGRPVEVVGTYNPRTNPASVDFKRERVDYWVSKGAQMSERVGKLYSKPAAAATPAASVA